MILRVQLEEFLQIEHIWCNWHPQSTIRNGALLDPRRPLVPLPSYYPTYPRGATILTSNSKSTFDYFLTLYYWLLLFSSLYVRFVNVV